MVQPLSRRLEMVKHVKDELLVEKLMVRADCHLKWGLLVLIVSRRSCKVRVEILCRETNVVLVRPSLPCEGVDSRPQLLSSLGFIDFAQFPAVESLDQSPDL